MMIHGWGRYPLVDAEIIAPLSRSDAQAAVTRKTASPVIARGLGRSYGDSSLAQRVISTGNLNYLLNFDNASGRICCGAGVSLADLLQVFVPRGWFLPVTPGTKFVTVGGAIASDVHGKNHHVNGCFSEYVDHLDLLLADGRILNCSRTEYPDLFHATCGGMGLTGVILEATLRLRRIQSAFMEQTTHKAHDLSEVLALFESHQNSTYSVAWIDCSATGAALGRSLLMTGEHSQDGALVPQTRQPVSIPFNLPSKLLNRYSIQIFNTLYYHRVINRESKQKVHYERFFYPLDGIHHWNRLYGKSGFTQYQFVIPKAAGPKGLSAICQRIAASQRGSFLAVLKAFGPENHNLLSFPMEGYTLALDFKLEHGLFELLEELDAMIIDYSGRLYLTKDARMGTDVFKHGYPRWQVFQSVRERYEVKGRFVSQQSQRLGLD